MKASERAKAAGLKSLNEMAELTSYTSQALGKKYNSNRVQFEALLHGAVLKKNIINLGG